MGANMYQAWRVAFSTRMLLKQIRYIIDEEVDGDDMDYFKEEALGEWMHTTYGDMSKPKFIFGSNNGYFAGFRSVQCYN
jgi:hypothetical protein